MSRHRAIKLTCNVPCDRLTLTIRVGGEIDLARTLGCLLNVAERLILALDDHVLGREPAFVDFDAKLFRGQIADVPDRRPHGVAVPEVPADRLGDRKSTRPY